MDAKMKSEATEQNKWHYAAILLLLLAICDSFITHFGLSNGYIEEANPLMRYMYETSILGFFSIKIFLPILFIWIIAKLEPNAFLQLLIAVALFLYALILFKHIYWIYLLFLA